MSFVAAGATLAVGLYSANQQRGAAKDANRAQRDASAQTIAEERRQFDLTRSDQKAWLDAGTGALERQNAFLAGDMSGFMGSAGYRAALEGGTQAINRAAIGNLSGGGTAADLMQFGQDNATRFGDNYWSKLAGMSNTGGQVAQGLGQLGANMAGNIGNAYNTNAAQQRQSSYLTAGANIDLASTIGGQFNAWGQQRRAERPVQGGGFGGFAPNQAGWNGSSAFGNWGRGWAG